MQNIFNSDSTSRQMGSWQLRSGNERSSSEVKVRVGFLTVPAGMPMVFENLVSVGII